MWSFLLWSAVLLISGKGALSQVPDYETTPFSLPATSFSCENRPPGYYADVETGCRTYHVCDGNSHFTYLCPTRTLFQQRSRICDHSYLVRCEDSPSFLDDIYPEDEDEILLRLVESEEQARTENSDVISSQTVKITTDSPEEVPATEMPTTVGVENPRTEFRRVNETSSEGDKVLKFVVKDIRSLFYIPEVENNSLGIQAEREFALPVGRKNLMRFRYGKKLRHAFSACPGYCDPKFFLPGTCHPCIMIK